MKHSVGILVFPNFQLLDVTGPAAVFETADYFSNRGEGYDVHVVSLNGGLISCSLNIKLESKPLSNFSNFHTLIIPGGVGAHSPELDPSHFKIVSALAKKCKRITSVCTGTFILAGSGLADGRKVTTHWRHSTDLAAKYPKLNVEADRIWVRDGKIWSSAGVTAGIDLALALVEEDFGDEVAKKSAREVVVYYKRPGGQSQYSTIEELGGSDKRFKSLLAWVRENIAQAIKVEDLAEQVSMSTRNFSRQFQKAVGRTPAKAVEQIRVEEAKILVESTELSIDKIANQCGFTDSERMRRAFIRMFGRAPSSLREKRMG